MKRTNHRSRCLLCKRRYCPGVMPRSFLETLVALAGMSTSRFECIFVETFGMPPLRYVNLMRVNAARSLLENTDKLLSEIATETGFFDQSHLTRVFKKERGITPGQYRRLHNKQRER